MSFVNDLRKIVLENDTLSGKIFDYTIQFLILLSLVTFSVETLPDISENTRIWLKNIEIITVIIFTFEYLLRIILSPKRFKFIFSFMGIVDLLAIAPFYLSTGLDLRSIRVFRMFRLLRLFKLLRYNRSVNRFKYAFLEIKSELLFFAIACMFLIYLSAVGIYYFEKDTNGEMFKSIFHSMWWAIATLTTVGYGDSYPITTGGKIFASLIIFIGLGLVAVPTGLIASAFSKAVNPEEVKKENAKAKAEAEAKAKETSNEKDDKNPEYS
jgi:voltage-gated potassium channel